MTNSLTGIIRQLEQQRTAIDRALEALREVEASDGKAAAPASGARGQAKGKGGMTPEGRRRLSESLKARWAAKRAGSQAASKSASPKSTSGKSAAGKSAAGRGGITPEGRKKLSEALRQRWAAKRADSTVAAGKAAAAKKAARKQA